MVAASSDYFVSGDIKIRCEKPLGVDFLTVTVMEARNLANRGGPSSSSTHYLFSRVLTVFSAHTVLRQGVVRQTREKNQTHQTCPQSSLE